MLISCQCGCDQKLERFLNGRPRKYVRGHYQSMTKKRPIVLPDRKGAVADQTTAPVRTTLPTGEED